MMKTDRAKSLCAPLAEECERDDVEKYGLLQLEVY